MSVGTWSLTEVTNNPYQPHVLSVLCRVWFALRAGFYYYLHRGTQSSQWHKPPGLLPHKDIPLARTDPATLSSLSDGSSSLLPAIKKKRRKGALSEHAAFWGRTPQTQAYHRDRYMNGRSAPEPVDPPYT